MESVKAENDKRVPGYVGLAAQLLLFVGVANIVLAGAAIFRSADYTGAGLCGIASALSLGLLLNGFVRR